MNVFELRQNLLASYAASIRSFIQIRDPVIRATVGAELKSGLLWPESLIQLNPSFEPGRTTDELADEAVLHTDCRRVFRINPDLHGEGRPLRLHRHQEDAVRVAREGVNYVLTTGTGSGKSLAYIVPIVDHVLRWGASRRRSASHWLKEQRPLAWSAGSGWPRSLGCPSAGSARPALPARLGDTPKTSALRPPTR
jgi:hypothetical protein